MSVISTLIRRTLNSAGYTVYKTDLGMHDKASMAAGLERLAKLGINPAAVVDIGAAQGTWTAKALNIWPAAKYELIEPLVEQTEVLTALKKQHPRIDFHLAVAGEQPGKASLNVSPDLDGSGVYGEGSDNARQVPVVTIDEITRSTPGDILVKFDTHGYELPILKGAQEALKRTSVLIIEVYGFRISPTCLVFHELSAYLDNAGFRLLDIVDVVRRPGDEAFWQADAFYLRKDHPVFQKNSYA